MRFIIHLALLSGAAVANSFTGNANSHKALSAALMKNARRLNGTTANPESQANLSSYVVKFEKCHERAVVFTLCSAIDCDACNTKYGEYLIELERYLDVTVAHARELEEDMCYACAECDGDHQSENVDCSTCADECEKYRNTEANGFIDALNFIDCQLVYDPADDSMSPLWAGPVCASSGSKITIGVFSDSDCNILDAARNVEDYLVNADGMPMQISHALLKTVYSDDCMSCDQKDRNGSTLQALEMCRTLHEGASKCEAMHGFAGGNPGDNNSYDVLIAQEATVCNIINTVTNRTNTTSDQVSTAGTQSWIGSSGSGSGGETETTLDDFASLMSYAVKFEKCIDNSAFDSQLVVDQQEYAAAFDSRFVVLFKLCPTNDCDVCTSYYGEYLIDLEKYLDVTVTNAKRLQHDMCYACSECDGDHHLENVDCSTCTGECEKILNAEVNGYVDAFDLIQCQMIYDPADDSLSPLWAGPACSSSGSKIFIGVFTDADCTILDPSKDVDDYLMDGDGNVMAVNYALLKTVYSDNCISCAKDERKVSTSQALEMCGTLHQDATKCDAMPGVAGGNPGDKPFCETITSATGGTNTSWIGSGGSDSGEDSETTLDDFGSITAHAVKFEKCIDNKAFSTHLAVDHEDYAAAFDAKFIVLFKLCPASDCDACTTNYGEYLIDLEKYLDVTVAHAKESEEEMCLACAECDGDHQMENVDCSTCADECEKYGNMEANGYIDASLFIECQLIYDPADDAKSPLWVGPLCASSGSKITIGVFRDSDCTILDASKDVEDYLIDGDGTSLKLSHALLKTVYSDDCMSCAHEDRNGRISQSLKRCGTLHEEASKCEAMHSGGNSCDVINFVTDVTNQTSGQQTPTAEPQSLLGSNSSGTEGETEATLNNVASLTSYSIKFEKCIDYNAFGTQLVVDQDNPKRVAVFKLCPANDCGACNSNYGEYLIDLVTYLEVSVERAKQEQAIACDACSDCSADRDVRRLLDVDCSTCADECEKIMNMEANGYYDASNFIECQLIYDPSDDSVAPLYAGPVCTSSGSKITIGVFSDKDCTVLDASKDVDDYLVSNDGYSMMLSHALLKTTYKETCRSCGREYTRHGVFTNDICGTLHEYAAKCEAMHDFAGGNADGDNNSPNVLIAHEASICDMIHSMTNGTYTSSDSGAYVEGESDTADEGGAPINSVPLSGNNSSSGGEGNATTNTGASRGGGVGANQTADADASTSAKQGNTEIRAPDSTSAGGNIALALSALGTVVSAMLF
jgi:hypothetical protein